MTEQATLLLRHVGKSCYVVDEAPPSDEAVYDALQPRISWQIGDLTAALGGLGWTIEEDRDEGLVRRLSLRRDSPNGPTA